MHLLTGSRAGEGTLDVLVRCSLVPVSGKRREGGQEPICQLLGIEVLVRESVGNRPFEQSENCFSF
jgi:hypothetical protein